MKYTKRDFYDFINNYISIVDVAYQAGVINTDKLTRNTSVFCPFHDDAREGHLSGKIYVDTNSFYCFAERKVYGAVDFLYLLGKKYHDLWQEYGNDFKEIYHPGFVQEKPNKNKEAFEKLIQRPNLMRYAKGEIFFKEFSEDLNLFLENPEGL